MVEHHGCGLVRYAVWRGGDQDGCGFGGAEEEVVRNSRDRVVQDNPAPVQTQSNAFEFDLAAVDKLPAEGEHYRCCDVQHDNNPDD